ncbi:LIF receptor subunit alpha a [Dunckerocampus dactyliophorus]|uniref:LIF receptor subunit alpha a n=1 Tax=Dunckerocampus dactyliophorus TaxID=161453 RepID=UPI0024049788|nr:LIF receptor subunit alpha a [Dunckerocampus dactyliophorus]
MLQLHASCRPVWLICGLLGLSVVHTHAQNVLTVPQQVSLSPNMKMQQIAISWLGGGATMFDVMILRTELNQTVFYDTLPVTVNQATGRYEWNWTSTEPLQCTSLSIRIRSREGQAMSEWSETQIHQGNDLPTNVKFQLYPQDRVVTAGGSTTFCCIVAEGRLFGSIRYGNTIMNATRLSRRSYGFTADDQVPTNRTGTNVICQDSLDKTKLSGTVVFVGYPPLLSDFLCETHDLTSAVCQWKEVRDTRLYRKRGTIFSLNNRKCAEATVQEWFRMCSVAQWEGNWTLEAVNPLGVYRMSDSAEIWHRVRPVAPTKLMAVISAWNASVLWKWEYESYTSLALVCQVELSSQSNKTKRTFTGVGLSTVLLLDLYPDEDYSVKVRCGAQKNFWKWGNWSQAISFKTNIDVPDAPNVWIHINNDNTGQILWMPLTARESHGQITSYEVTLWSPEQNLQHTETLSPDTFELPINLTQIAAFSNGNEVMATVLAKNAAGASPPISVIFPLHVADKSNITVSRVVYMDRGFPLVWQDDANSSCGYVVEWHDALCQQDCPVEWLKLAMGKTNVSIESANFQPGVRYNISLFTCTLELLQRWQGYMQELAPSRSVPQLQISQQDSDVILTWGAIPEVSRRGDILGYNVYMSNDSHLVKLANLLGQGSREYIVKALSEGSYKFTIKAYTSAGEDTGATISITVEPLADWLILEMLASLGCTALLLAIVTFLCYKKRKWVKTAFYPDIPQPKLNDDWTRTRGPLDVTLSPHNMVHVVEKPQFDSIKEVLVGIPEEDEEEEEQIIRDEPVDTDEPTSLHYYNQMIDERPIRPRFPDSSDSSGSSLDSGHTDVTYTGIQTSASSLVFQTSQQGPSEGHQANMAISGGGYRPQTRSTAPSDDALLPQSSQEPQAACSGGYKPQTSWHLDSPEDSGERDGLAPHLGSPTSVASTQFLLPDSESEEHREEKRQHSSSAASWFTNLLASTKP